MSPFAQPLNYDPAAKNAVGTITLSDPKLYTREMLVSERNQDVAWINQLIKDSEDVTKVKFAPDMLREAEQISAFAASLGLKVDPAAALNYNRAKGAADKQQQIEDLKIQLQLEQIKRDAELLRAKYADQTDPVNQDLGKLGTEAVGQAASGVTAPSTAEIRSSIDALLSAVTARLDKAGTPAAEANVSVNPIDDFRDRTAYRDLLKSARNAAALDESHDANAQVLLRLNFQAMVVPDPDLPRSLGAVQLKVLAPEIRPSDQILMQDSFLAQWLRYENFSKDQRKDDGTFKSDGEIAQLVGTGLFDVRSEYGVPGLYPHIESASGVAFTVSALYDYARWTDVGSYDEDKYSQQASNILSVAAANNAQLNQLRLDLCEGKYTPAAPGAADTTDWMKVNGYAEISSYRLQSYAYKLLARDIASWAGKNPPDLDAQTVRRALRAGEYLRSLETVLGTSSNCQAYVAGRRRNFGWSAISKGGLNFDANKVHIYDVGPREQVERVSTVARSANSLSLAASLAASDPGSGAAVDAAGGYSRQAMGRASVIERVPTAVGYAVAGDQTFGWVLGPRATIDARGKVKIEQLLKPFDLSVDVSVPSWWESLKLQVRRVWAPSPAALVHGELSVSDQPISPGDENEDQVQPRIEAVKNDTERDYVITVPLPHREADYRNITHLLVAKGSLSVKIRSADGVVNACNNMWLVVRGTNVYRAQNVYVLGQKIDQSQFSILSDMDGIEIAVPAIAIKRELLGKQQVEVATPLGSDVFPIDYRPEPSGDACKPPKAANSDKPADPTAPVIDKVVTKLDFVIPGKFTITATGKNLSKVSKVLLNGDLKAALTVEDKDATLKMLFDASESGIAASDNVPLTLFDDKNKPLGDPIPVRIQREGK
ncbi:hypothetical protein [Sphingomonas sp. MMS24-J13]|uniref:hypothetical protein n=1 Tax=Sphingomonas sp. MMS24-J13 TaxID=3238686 RepID=UPI00384FFA8D